MPMVFQTEAELAERGWQYSHDAECPHCGGGVEMWVGADGVSRPLARKTAMVPHQWECRHLKRVKDAKENPDG